MILHISHIEWYVLFVHVPANEYMQIALWLGLYIESYSLYYHIYVVRIMECVFVAFLCLEFLVCLLRVTLFKGARSF